MELEQIVLEILEKQKGKRIKYQTDLKLVNGNINLRLFKILEYNQKDKILKGITFQEEYIYPRENRPPEYCYFSLEEIRELFCPYLSIHFKKEN